MKRRRPRLPPKRSPERWAREFVKALKARTGISVPAVPIKRTAARDARLRERVPASVAAIVETSARAAGLSPAEWARAAGRHIGLLTRQAKEIRRGLKELREALGIGAGEARRLVKRHPMLLGYAPRGLARRVAALQETTGLSVRESRVCARRCAGLLTFKAATLAAHRRKQCRLLGLSLAAYGKVVLREPRLLMRSPESIAGFLDGMVRLWGLSRQEALALFIKAPKLAVSGLAGTMDDNLARLTCGLGCEKTELVKAVKSFPALAYQKPERLIAALRARGRALGVSKATLVQAALRSPSLLARRTGGWARRMRLVVRIARALGAEIAAKDVLEKFPAAMTYGTGRLLQRYVMARLGLWSMNWTALLSLADERARQKLEEYFEQHAERAGLREALARRGLV